MSKQQKTLELLNTFVASGLDDLFRAHYRQSEEVIVNRLMTATDPGEMRFLQGQIVALRSAASWPAAARELMRGGDDSEGKAIDGA